MCVARWRRTIIARLYEPKCNWCVFHDVDSFLKPVSLYINLYFTNNMVANNQKYSVTTTELNKKSNIKKNKKKHTHRHKKACRELCTSIYFGTFILTKHIIYEFNVTITQHFTFL
jgi:hypothetical protein